MIEIFFNNYTIYQSILTPSKVFVVVVVLMAHPFVS